MVKSWNGGRVYTEDITTAQIAALGASTTGDIELTDSIPSDETVLFTKIVCTEAVAGTDITAAIAELTDGDSPTSQHDDVAANIFATGTAVLATQTDVYAPTHISLTTDGANLSAATAGAFRVERYTVNCRIES